MSSANKQYSEDEINLRDYWRVLARRRFLIGGIVCLTVLATAVFTLLQPSVYQSNATLMPLGQTAGDIRGMLGELGGLLPLSALGQDSPVERIQAILHSRTLAEDVIQRLDLLPRLFAKQWDATQQQWQTDKPPTVHDAVRALGSLVTVTTDRKTGVVTIAVEHTDAKLAATMANQYIEALQRILNDNAFSLAKKNRLFIEAQVQKTRQELTAAEEALRQFEQRHKIIALDAQATAAVQTIAALEGEIMAKEVQLRVLQRSVTGASREATLLQEELQGLQAQLARMQQGSRTSSSQVREVAQITHAFSAVEDAPEIKLQYARLQREATIQNKLFTLLMQQLEQAKIEEARDETAFQVLDRAIPPDKRSKPKRRQSVILATVVGGFLGVFMAFFRDYLDTTVRTRDHVERRLGLPLLATIPSARKPHRRWRSVAATSSEAQLVLHQVPEAPLVEAYRYLYTRLKYHKNGPGAYAVMCAGADSDEAVSVLLVNLAIVAAQAGEKTLLVDSNPRQPRLHRLLQCPLVPGLREVLAQPDEWQKAIQTTAVEQLHLLSAGTASTAVFPSCQSPTFDALLAHCRAAYDLLLFAVPPVLDASDAVMLSGKVDTTCLVVMGSITRLEVAEEAKAALEAVQARVVGAVLVVPHASA
jgi:tyrosine-protein kinase Etk/Wzc